MVVGKGVKLQIKDYFIFILQFSNIEGGHITFSLCILRFGISITFSLWDKES